MIQNFRKCPKFPRFFSKSVTLNCQVVLDVRPSAAVFVYQQNHASLTAAYGLVPKTVIHMSSTISNSTLDKCRGQRSTMLFVVQCSVICTTVEYKGVV